MQLTVSYFPLDSACREAPVPSGHCGPEGDPEVPEEHRVAHPQAALLTAGRLWSLRCAYSTVQTDIVEEGLPHREKKKQELAPFQNCLVPRTPPSHSGLHDRSFPPLGAQVREISNMVAPEPFRWTAEALLALQEV